LGKTVGLHSRKVRGRGEKQSKAGVGVTRRAALGGPREPWAEEGAFSRGTKGTGCYWWLGDPWRGVRRHGGTMSHPNRLILRWCAFTRSGGWPVKAPCSGGKPLLRQQGWGKQGGGPVLNARSGQFAVDFGPRRGVLAWGLLGKRCRARAGRGGGNAWILAEIWLLGLPPPPRFDLPAQGRRVGLSFQRPSRFIPHVKGKGRQFRTRRKRGGGRTSVRRLARTVVGVSTRSPNL